MQATILSYMCQGLESIQIAKRMGLSIGYVKHRRAEMLEISGCINSHHLTAWAAVRGYYKAMNPRDIPLLLSNFAGTESSSSAIVGAHS